MTLQEVISDSFLNSARLEISLSVEKLQIILQTIGT